MTAKNRIRRQIAYKKGLYAETLAIWYLRLRGYKIANRRYKTPYGEIDIVAYKNHVLVMIEVKRRRHYHEAHVSINPKAQKRIMKASEMYLHSLDKQKVHYSGLQGGVRFDAILIWQGKYRLLRLQHIKNAWHT